MPGAEFSDCGKFRYLLWREHRVEAGKPDLSVLFVMLNPSVADASQDDPTIRRCIGFAKLWGYTRTVVANLYAFRATDPADLWRAPAQVGPDNDRHIGLAAREADLVVCAWGAHAKDSSRVATVRKILRDETPPDLAIVALGFTKAGHPRHPLMLSYATETVGYR